MTTTAAVGLPAAYSWDISVGSGWILLIALGTALCFVCMLGFMWLMRDGRGWATCGRRGQQQATPRAVLPSEARRTARVLRESGAGSAARGRSWR